MSLLGWLFGRYKEAPPATSPRSARPADDSLRDDIRRRLEASQMFRTEDTGWMADASSKALAAGQGYEVARRTVVLTGKPLSRNEVRQLGLNARTKVGSRYVAALTTADYPASFDLLDEIISTASSAAAHRRQLDELEAAGVASCKLLGPNDGHETEIERRYSGKTMSIAEGRSLTQRHERDLRRSVFTAVFD